MRLSPAVLVVALGSVVGISPAAGAQSVDSLGPRAAVTYDVVRVRATSASRWTVGTVIAIAGDTLGVAVHGAPPAAPTLRIALDTIAAIERRVLVPGSRAKAAAEGLYWGVIAGGVVGWLGGATYGTLAGGTTWSEGGERGTLIGASVLGVGGAITLGARHMRGDNGPESIRVEWVAVPRP